MKTTLVFSKKFIILIFSFVFLVNSFSSPVFATGEWHNQLPLPKWTHISIISGGVMPGTDSSGRHEVGGDVILFDPDNRVEFTATVQHYNGAWYNTSYSWSTSGYATAGIAEWVYLNTGAYRMRFIVKVYSPSNVLLEETTIYTGDTVI